jgi:23S rRNA (uridine2552-2'-O)-methyltransferase
MAPNSIGNSVIDSIKINHLALEVVNFGYKLLNLGGYLITKYFSGKDELSLIKVSKYYFKKINFFKPASSRSESKEMYLVLSGLRKN